MKELNSDFIRRKKQILACNQTTTQALNKALEYTQKPKRGEKFDTEDKVESPEKKTTPVKAHKRLTAGLMARIEDTIEYNAPKQYMGRRSVSKTSEFKVPQDSGKASTVKNTGRREITVFGQGTKEFDCPFWGEKANSNVGDIGFKGRSKNS